MTTRTQFILTHTAVFTLGGAAALIAYQARSAPQDASLHSDARSTSNRSTNPRGSDSLSDLSSNPPSKTTRSEDLKKSRTTPAARFSEIVRLTDPFDRQRALMDLVQTLGPQEFQALADQYRETEHLRGLRSSGFDIILNGWAKVDPLAALAYTSENSSGRDAVTTVISTWAGQDPAAAEAWALSHHQGDGPNPYLPGLIRGLAGTDLAAATRLIQTLPRSNERGDAVDTITRALFVQGTDAALAYADTIPDENLRSSFVTSITAHLLGKDLTQAAAYVSSQPNGAIQSRAAQQVAQAMVNHNLAQATTWFSTLKPEAKAQAASPFILAMSANDIPSTAKWVSGLAGTPNYDRTVETFIWSCDTRSPEQSAAWISGISNPQQQLKIYYKMLGEWSKKDPAAVKSWVATNAVPPAISKKFLTP